MKSSCLIAEDCKVSKLTICVISVLTLSFFSSFIYQTQWRRNHGCAGCWRTPIECPHHTRFIQWHRVQGWSLLHLSQGLTRSHHIIKQALLDLLFISRKFAASLMPKWARFSIKKWAWSNISRSVRDSIYCNPILKHLPTPAPLII